VGESLHSYFRFGRLYFSKSISLRDEVIDASEAVQSLLMLQHSSSWNGGQSDDGAQPNERVREIEVVDFFRFYRNFLNRFNAARACKNRSPQKPALLDLNIRALLILIIRYEI
jgi:hypothetical protein